MTDFEPRYPPGPADELPDTWPPPQPPYGEGANTWAPPQPAYGAPRGTNVMAVVAIVVAFVVPPLGVVFGVIGRRQIRRTGEDGDGLALAGIVLGTISTILAIVWLVIVIRYVDAQLGNFFEDLPNQQ